MSLLDNKDFQRKLIIICTVFFLLMLSILVLKEPTKVNITNLQQLDYTRSMKDPDYVEDNLIWKEEIYG